MRIPNVSKNLTILCLGGIRYNHFIRDMGHRIVAIVDKKEFKQHDDDHLCLDFWHPDSLIQCVKDCIDQYSPDVLLQVDFHSPIIHFNIEQYSIPKILYVWTNAETRWYNHYSAIFNHVFYAQQESSNDLSSFQKQCSWLPFSHRIGREPKPFDSRQYLISLCQIIDPIHTPKTNNIIKALAEKGIEVAVHGDVIWPFVDSKICLNIPENNNLDFPFFDIPGFGALMISSRVAGMEKFLIEGEDFLAFSTIDELFEKIDWVIENPSLVLPMIERAQKKIKEFHTNRQRCEEMIEKAYEVCGHLKVHSPIDLAHLGYAYQQCSQYKLNETLEKYCIDRSMELTEEVKYDPASRPWALLSNAILAFEHEDYLRGYRTIANVMEIPDNIEYRLQYYNYYVMLAVQSEFIFKAASKLREALTLYPDYPHFIRLAKAISLEEVEKKMEENEQNNNK